MAGHRYAWVQLTEPMDLDNYDYSHATAQDRIDAALSKAADFCVDCLCEKYDVPIEVEPVSVDVRPLLVAGQLTFIVTYVGEAVPLEQAHDGGA